MRSKEPIPNKKLRAARLAKSWTLAKAAEEAQSSIEAYSRWEYGTQEPRLSSLLLLCEGFGMTAEALGFGHLVKRSNPRQPDEPSSPPGIITLTQEQVITLSSLLQGENIMDQTRREALRRILATTGMALAAPLLPGSGDAWERLTSTKAPSAALDTAAFDHFEHLLGESWALSNSNELDVAEGVLASFLPKLLAVPSREVTPTLAYLASQGLRLQSVLVHHRLHIAEKILLCEKSVEYARYADNADTLVPALIELADAYEFDGQLEKCLQTLQEALYHSSQASALLQSRAYSNNAIILAATGRKKEAELYIGLAHDVFPDTPLDDPGYALADASVFTLSYHTGLVRLDTDQVHSAPEGFVFYQQHPAGKHIPERLRLEIVNGLSKAAIRANDLERYITYLDQALVGAVALGSKKRFDEAVRMFQQEIPGAWRTDNRIKQIAEKYDLEG
jgi:transcriptional regulator with XRE-family HTH domain